MSVLTLKSHVIPCTFPEDLSNHSPLILSSRFAFKIMPFKILIIGGGLGGLATGIALGQKGHRVTILESTAKLQTLGGGISIPPNSTRVMDYLGILDDVNREGEVSGSHKTYFRRYTGEFICDGGERSSRYGYE